MPYKTDLHTPFYNLITNLRTIPQWASSIQWLMKDIKGTMPIFTPSYTT